MRRLPIALSLVTLLTGCPDDRLVKTLPPDVYVDTYPQRSAAKVDVLWIVDNSGSMAEEQENLAKNFASFINLFTRGSIDYRIAVTTTDTFNDAGQFKGSPRILTPQTGNVAEAFGRNIRVGTAGSPFEAGLDAAEMAIERQRTANAPALQQIEACKAGCKDATCVQSCTDKFPVEFLRPDAFLYLIFVSDEEDKSRQDVRYYWRAFDTANGVGNDGTINTAAIVGPENNACSANHGSRYIALTGLTGGDVGSICDTTFADTLRKLANNAVGLRRKFALSRKPNIATLGVTVRYPCDVAEDFIRPCASVDRTACGEAAAPDAVALECVPQQGGADGWQYEQATNVIYFAGDSVPGLNAHVDIQYYEEGKGPS